MRHGLSVRTVLVLWENQRFNSEPNWIFRWIELSGLNSPWIWIFVLFFLALLIRYYKLRSVTRCLFSKTTCSNYHPFIINENQMLPFVSFNWTLKKKVKISYWTTNFTLFDSHPWTGKKSTDDESNLTLTSLSWFVPYYGIMALPTHLLNVRMHIIDWK